MARRFRFSIRTLAFVVTLVCAYFGAWEATKRYGLPQSYLTVEEQWAQNPSVVSRRIIHATSPLPLVICQTESEVSGSEVSFGIGTHRHISELRSGDDEHYYFWLFGPKIEMDWPVEWNPSDVGGFF